MRRRQVGWLVVGVVAVGGLVRCGSVPLTAPGGSTILGQANPDFVIANGGVSVITALVTAPNGNLVANGTNVFFLTDLGRIDASVQTRDGMARANFVSDSRSGTAHIQIWSGGAASANPTPAPTPTPTPGGFGAPAPASFGARSFGGGAASLPMGAAAVSGVGSVQVSVNVGSALPAHIIVTADPDHITSPRHATIVANVFDTNGNPVQNVPIIFSVAAAGGAALQETLASGGVPQFTDSNGQAFDQLNTRAPNGTSQTTVTVTATPPGAGTAGTASVVIDYTPASGFAGR